MKLSAWAKEQGIGYLTAWRWFKNGTLPVPAVQLKTGTILVTPQKAKEGKTAIYARVSSADQKGDLDRQVARLIKFANANRLKVALTITEIGSGLNGHRKKTRTSPFCHREALPEAGPWRSHREILYEVASLRSQ